MKSRTVRIGITGPIGCGKTTVTRWLRELGAETIDADVIARDVVEPGEPAFEAVVAAFGSDVVREDGSLDRPALGRLVFADAAALRRLEAIVHPAVRPRILAAMAAAERAGAAAIVVEAIKLVEGGLAAVCHEVWLVTCESEVQRERLVARGTPPDDAAARIAAQGDLAARLRPAATRVIETSADPATVRAAVAEAYQAAIGTGRTPTGLPGE